MAKVKCRSDIAKNLNLIDCMCRAESNIIFSDPALEARRRKFDLFLSKLNGSVVTGGRREAHSQWYHHCEYQARDAENCKTEAEALLLMAQMLREDAKNIEEFAKSMQDESTNQG